jgi:hypothetical protein
MSTPAPHVHPAPTAGTELQELKIVSHSNLFYWWPLWAIGFIMALLTYLDGGRMAIISRDTHLFHNATVITSETRFDGVDALVAPKGETIPPSGSQVEADRPYLHVAENKSFGVLYTIVLLLLIVITNVPMRGLWSVVVIIVIVMLSIIFALANWWAPILNAMGRLHIHINAAGYLLISLALFVIWLVTFVLFDPQIYMVFTPGQLRVRQSIGGGEDVHDTAGMVVQKQRNDLFRHWILGLGSGDLIVKTSGATSQHFDLPNVLFIGYKVKQIEDMLREKPVVQGGG